LDRHTRKYLGRRCGKSEDFEIGRFESPTTTTTTTRSSHDETKGRDDANDDDVWTTRGARDAVDGDATRRAGTGRWTM
jgi:hypothetical protein